MFTDFGSELQPTEMKMHLGVAMRLPPYTVHCFKVKEDSLVTAGCVVPRGREELDEKSW